MVEEVAVVKDAVLAPDEARDPVRDAGLAQGRDVVSALGVEEQRVNVIIDFVDPLEARPTLGDNFRVEARIVVWEAPDVVRAPVGANDPCGAR